MGKILENIVLIHIELQFFIPSNNYFKVEATVGRKYDAIKLKFINYGCEMRMKMRRGSKKRLNS